MGELNTQKFNHLVQLMVFWSEQWQMHILAHGVPLESEELQFAQCVGVIQPEKIRVLKVPNVPMPHYRLLHEKFVKSGLFSPDAFGLTVGYGIFLRFDSFPLEYWLTHESVHVAQMERMGGLLPCMRQYLEEYLSEGYESSGLEQEAHQTALKCLAEKGITFDFEIELGTGEIDGHDG